MASTRHLHHGCSQKVVLEAHLLCITPLVRCEPSASVLRHTGSHADDCCWRIALFSRSLRPALTNPNTISRTSREINPSAGYCTVSQTTFACFFFVLLCVLLFLQVHRQINKQVKATVWMAHNYPLKLKHIMPALEILSVRVREPAEAEKRADWTDMIEMIVKLKCVCLFAIPGYGRGSGRGQLFITVSYNLSMR